MSKTGTGQSGSVLLAVFAAIGAVGIVGASSMAIMKGPVRGMHTVTQKTIAENNMIASGKLAVMAASNQPSSGDCDGDSTVEPIAWSNTGTGPKPTGGGYLPSNIGASLQDPWGNTYGYCAWDHGAAMQTTCSTPTQRLRGGADKSGPVIAVISSGADRTFQTTCADAPAYVTKVSGSDDIVLTYTYDEAQTLSGGLWNLKSGDLGTAEINKNLEVKNAANNVVFGVDSTTDINKPSIKVDYIKALSQPRVENLSPLRISGTNMTLDLLTGASTSSYTASLGVNDDGFNLSLGSASRGFNFKNNNGTLLSVNPDGDIVTMRRGVTGTYNSSQVQGVWSIGDAYRIDTTANDFGTQYGIVYGYTSAGAGAKKPIAGWGHQLLFTSAGTPNAAISLSYGHGYFAGNVGIGNDAPSNKLHVTGNIGATGWVGAGCEGACEGSGGYSLLYADGSGTLTTVLRTPIFRDLDDSNYYVDPASTSALNAIEGKWMGLDYSSSYDVWIQGSHAGSTGSARNLALLGNKSTDTLYLNYNGEYAGGVRISGPVTITGSLSASGGISGFTETDPQVSAVTSGKWCRGTGSAVTCDQDAPGGGMPTVVTKTQSSACGCTSGGQTCSFTITCPSGTDKPFLCSFSGGTQYNNASRVFAPGSTNCAYTLNSGSCDGGGDASGWAIIFCFR